MPLGRYCTLYIDAITFGHAVALYSLSRLTIGQVLRGLTRTSLAGWRGDSADLVSGSWYSWPFEVTASRGTCPQGVRSGWDGLSGVGWGRRGEQGVACCPLLSIHWSLHWPLHLSSFTAPWSRRPPRFNPIDYWCSIFLSMLPISMILLSPFWSMFPISKIYLSPHVSVSVYIFDLRFLILVVCLRFRLRFWSPREFRRLCLDYQDVFATR